MTRKGEGADFSLEKENGEDAKLVGGGMSLRITSPCIGQRVDSWLSSRKRFLEGWAVSGLVHREPPFLSSKLAPQLP